MDSVEDYARQWTKREKEDVDNLFQWIKAVRSLIQIRIKKLNGSINAHTTSIFNDCKTLSLPPTFPFMNVSYQFRLFTGFFIT